MKHTVSCIGNARENRRQDNAPANMLLQLVTAIQE